VAYNSVGSPATVVGYGNGKLDSTIGSGRVYDPNDPSTFPTTEPLGYSTYSASPGSDQPGGHTPTFPANPAAVRTQYTGAPEL
jgi:hypothetical protein